MPLKQVIKDSDGNFVRFANVSAVGGAADNTEIIERLDAVDVELAAVKQTADGALPKTGGEVTGSINLKIPVVLGELPEYTQSRLVRVSDSASQTLGQFIVAIRENGQVDTSLYARNKIENGSLVEDGIRIYAKPDGITYATCPPPRGLYTNDIATWKSVVDRFLQRVPSYHVSIFIDAVNGNDTADLHNGRGLSQDKPFKSLEAAYSYAAFSYGGNGGIIFYLLSDLALSNNFYPRISNVVFLQIRSLDAANKKKLLLGNNYIGVRGNYLYLQDIEINGDGCAQLFYIDGSNGYVLLATGTNVTFSGNVTSGVLNLTNGGRAHIGNTITGDINGKRYNIIKGSMITTNNGPNAIPGTEAGTCDASSVYA